MLLYSFLLSSIETLWQFCGGDTSFDVENTLYCTTNIFPYDWQFISLISLISWNTMLSSYNASGIDFVSYGVSQRFRDIIIYIYI